VCPKSDAAALVSTKIAAYALLVPVGAHDSGQKQETDVHRVSSQLSRFVIQGEQDAVALVLSDVEQPHGDELTFFRAQLLGEGLSAECPVESLSGDEGFRTDPAASTTPEVTTSDSVRLSAFLTGLAGLACPWEGLKGWRSLAGDLTMYASCDATGHVTLTARIEPRPWRPTWSLPRPSAIRSEIWSDSVANSRHGLTSRYSVDWWPLPCWRQVPPPARLGGRSSAKAISLLCADTRRRFIA
jgi:hypothetical protein